MKIRAVLVAAVLLVGFSTALAQTPSSDQQIVASFKKFALNFEKHIPENWPTRYSACGPNHAQVLRVQSDPDLNSIPGYDPGQWFNGYAECPVISIDVRKTDSLISPYVGTVSYHMPTVHTSADHDSEKDAEQDHDFHAQAGEGSITNHFGYQEGTWKLIGKFNQSTP